jgi:DNA-binding CsgD family transcriptional regulator
MQKDFPSQVIAELTEREREILRLIATGTSNKDIAYQLFISSNTVKVHLRNIFAKIGVTSRTEAAVYAIREGLSQAVDPPAVVSATQESPVSLLAPFDTKNKPYFLWLAALVTVLLVGGVFFVVATYRTPAPAPTVAVTSSAPVVTLQRWQEHAAMPTARSGLAVASQENLIYAIGGETKVGVTSVVERYDLITNTWAGLSSKPTAVADVCAAVIGGRIYVSGGRLASGEVTNILEIYDPLMDTWEKGSPMPVALSAYAIAAFEGRLFLFGGWDGKQYVDLAFAYEPGRDQWDKLTPMPSARGFAGAAVAGGKIYVIGGIDGKSALAINEEYIPDRDTWSRRAPLPARRYALGAASIADIIYVVGGEGETGSSLPPLQYVRQQDQWQEFEGPFSQRWSHLGLVPLQTQLYGVGGWWNDIPAAQNLSYQAIYTIIIPVIR